MNFLIARTSNRQQSRKYVKVLDDCEIFGTIPDLSSSIEYQNTYTLNDEEFFKIENFSSESFCIDLLRNTFNSTSYSTIGVADYSKIKYICSYQDNRYFFFQRCGKNSIIKNKFIKLRQPTLLEDENILVIRDDFDALYDKEDDILYFTSLTRISGIFKGIQDLYREATQEETAEFLNSDIINLQNGFSADNVKTANRKRIAIAIDTLNSFSPSDKSTICGYIQSYCPDLNYNDNGNQFDISNEDELKNLLYGIEQRFYTTGVGSEKRIANSILKI